MRKALCLAVVLVCVLIGTCKSPSTPEKAANVVMIEGPIFEDGYSIFYWKGRVQNKGTAKAGFTKVWIYLRRTDNSLIAQDYTYVDDSDLAPNETSAWDVLFSDSDGSKRATMDKGKTTYDIKWN